MKLLTRAEFLSLADVRDSICISLYLPTDRRSTDGYKQDKIEFKNLLYAVSTDISERYELRPEAIETLLKPAYDLLGDHQFWQHNADLLTVFLYDGQLQLFRLPLEFAAPKHFVGDRLHLRPLVPMLTSAGHFLILSLHLEQVKLFEAMRHGFHQIALAEEVSEEVGDLTQVGNKKQSLQFKGVAGSQGQGGLSDQANREDVTEFLREVDQMITEVLGDQKLPLVLIGSENLISTFRSLSRYPNLYAEHVTTNSAKGHSDQELHDLAVELMSDHLDEPLIRARSRYEESIGAELHSADTRKTLLATWAGQVDTLFIHPDANVWGTYDEAAHKVHLTSKPTAEHYDLLDEAAFQTLRNSGTVFLTAEPPINEDTPLAAILRYAV